MTENQQEIFVEALEVALPFLEKEKVDCECFKSKISRFYTENSLDIDIDFNKIQSIQ